MRPERYEIYLARIQLRHSEDLRPWVVIGNCLPDPQNPGKMLLTVAPISSQIDLMVEFQDFPIEAGHPDFPATGLRRSSYVIGNLPARVSVDRLERRLGELRGELRREFERFCGD
jgi:hypothetical protein